MLIEQDLDFYESKRGTKKVDVIGTLVSSYLYACMHAHGTYMIMDYLSDVITFSVHVELPKVIHQGAHAGRQVQHTIHQLAERDFPYTFTYKQEIN